MKRDSGQWPDNLHLNHSLGAEKEYWLASPSGPRFHVDSPRIEGTWHPPTVAVAH
jgi:hypothetical protein